LTPGIHPSGARKNLYDNAGQLLKVQKAYGVTTANGFPKTLQQDYVTYTYTNNGKQQFVTDANGNKAQFTWDGFDRLSKWNFPSPTTAGTVSTTDYEQYTYDPAGNRLSLRRRDGRTLTFAYDNLNRMLSKLIPDGCPPIQPPGTGCPPASATRDVFYGYDLLGRQLTARFDSTSGADGIANAYDGFGNLTSSQISMAGFTKAVTSLYDLDNNRTRVTHPDVQAFTYAYDGRDRLSGVYEGIGTGSPLDTFAFNADDTLASRSENGTGAGSAAYTYDPIGRLATQSDAFPSFATKNVGWTFGVNPASQITQETRDNDAYAFTGIATSNKAYSVNGLNQYTAVAGTGHTYDANGNLTGDGTNAYIYDGENRLVSATAAGVTATLTYDPLGRLWRVQKAASDTRFLYDGDALVAEYDAAGTLANRYVHGSDVKSDDPLIWYVGSGTATKRYLHSDHNDSIVAATNVSGGPSINSYDEYGVPGAANVGRFQYTGQAYIPELALYYYKARMYSAALGRFLQVDPVGYKDQVNLYAYVGDDPMNANDPSGLQEAFMFGVGDAAKAATYQGGAPSTDDIADALDAFADFLNSQPEFGGPIEGKTLGALAGAFRTEAKVARAAERTAARATRQANLAKGIPASRLGPSGKPLVHTVQHSTRKAAQEAAGREARQAGGRVRTDAHPRDGQKPHFQAQDAKGQNVKPVVHHCPPDGCL